MKFPKSVRSRIVAGFVIILVFALLLAGILSTVLISTFLTGHEMDHLEANAQSLASQAISYIVPNMQLVPLADLARSFSFLNDVRIRIMDSTKHLVLDTGGIKKPENAIWAVLIPDGGATNMRPITGRLSESDTGSLATLESRGASSSGEESQKTSERFVWHINKYILPSGTMLDIQSTGGLPPTKTPGEVYISDSDGGTVEPSKAETSLAGKQKEFSLIAKFLSIISLETVTAVQEMIDSKGWVVGYVELNYEMNPFRAVVNYAQLAFLFAAVVAVILAIPIGIISSRRITTPLIQLSDVAIRMSLGDFSVRAKIKGEDEIGILAKQFNQMACRIEELFRQSNEDRDTLRRFVSDASHELRTPLSALANSIELLQNAASNDPLARTKFLKICESQVQRLGWITGSLLDLSRMNARNPELDWGIYQPFDLVKEVVSAFEEQAKRKGIQIIIKNHEPEGKINCDRSRMIMALSNLIDNAVKFTDPGGIVEISVHMASDEITCKFRVQDTGTGIPETDLPHVFERFYRGRTNQSQGCGLGLAIVESVATIHGGNVTIESKLGEGTVVTISIPGSPTGILS